MSFQVTTAIRKLFKVKKRVRIIQGGTSAGKTYGILPVLIDYAARYPKTEISVVSETMPHLKKGAMRDFLKIMSETGRYIPDHWNISNSLYTFTNGSYIEFFSADSQDKVRGPRRDILYINECNNISFETYNQLAIRTRKTIWLDYNPTSEFWVHSELLAENDTEQIILTYKDNEALTDTIVAEIEKARTKAFYDETKDNLFEERNIKSAYWANWWKVYGMGQTGSVQGCIFTDWSIVENVPQQAQTLGYGIDFGFSSDPSTLVRLSKFNNELYAEELMYRTGMTNKDIADELKRNGVTSASLVIADSAEPKSIAEINRYGFHVLPCVKGADSINFGIDTMQQHHYNITAESTNLIKELRNYVWETDKAGARTGRPIGGYDHLIDALRYISVKVLARQSAPSRGVRLRN